MPRYDLRHNESYVRALNNTTIGSSTTTAGAIIDLQGYQSCSFVFGLGTRTDGTFTPLVEEGNAADLSDAVAVADEDLLGGTEASTALNASNAASGIGYIPGRYRYVRLSIVSSGVTTGSTGVGAIAILGTPMNAPTVNA